MAAFRSDPDEITRTIVIKAYAHFCAEHATRPAPAVAQRFVVEVTESGARPYHGLDAAQLEALLAREFPAPGETAEARR